jgi:hypothetical protein
MINRHTQIVLTGYIKQTATCWLWLKKNGYIIQDGKRHYVHRLMYQIFHDEKLAVKTWVTPKCRIHNCVNPNHLMVVSPAKFAQIPDIKSRNFHRKKTHCKNGHEFSPGNIYKTKTNHRYCKACNNAFKRRAKQAQSQHNLGTA